MTEFNEPFRMTRSSIQELRKQVFQIYKINFHHFNDD